MFDAARDFLVQGCCNYCQESEASVRQSAGAPYRPANQDRHWHSSSRNISAEAESGVCERHCHTPPGVLCTVCFDNGFCLFVCLQGVVVAVGAGLPRGDTVIKPVVQVGDKVLLPEYGGSPVQLAQAPSSGTEPAETSDYHLYREEDLLAVIEEE